MSWELVRPPSGSNGRAICWTELGEDVEVLVDYFPPLPHFARARCLVLTHCHEDHRRGVEVALAERPGATLYCTALTRVLLLARLPALHAHAHRFAELPLPTDDPDEPLPPPVVALVGTAQRCAQLCAIDAGHCAGAACVRVEASFGVALFTGDVRWDDVSPDPLAVGDGDGDGVGGCGEPAGRAQQLVGGGGGAGEARRLDLLVVDTTCCGALAALQLPTRAESIEIAAAAAAAHARATSGCQRVWVDASCLGQEPLLRGVAAALDGRARIVCAPRPDDAAPTKAAARLRELWDLPAAVRGELVTPAAAARLAAAGEPVRVHAWVRAHTGGRAVAAEALAAGALPALPPPGDLMLSGTTLWWACDAPAAAAQPSWLRPPAAGAAGACARLGADGVLHVPYSMHAPRDALRALVAALRPLRVEPLLEAAGGAGLSRTDARERVCRELGRSAAEARADAAGSIEGAAVPVAIGELPPTAAAAYAPGLYRSASAATAATAVGSAQPRRATLVADMDATLRVRACASTPGLLSPTAGARPDPPCASLEVRQPGDAARSPRRARQPPARGAKPLLSPGTRHARARRVGLELRPFASPRAASLRLHAEAAAVCGRGRDAETALRWRPHEAQFGIARWPYTPRAQSAPRA
jgi:hypothetical protein